MVSAMGKHPIRVKHAAFDLFLERVTLTDIAKRLNLSRYTVENWATTKDEKGDTWASIRLRYEEEMAEAYDRNLRKRVQEERPRVIDRHLQLAEKFDKAVDDHLKRHTSDTPLPLSELNTASAVFTRSAQTAGRIVGLNGSGKSGKGNVSLFQFNLAPTRVPAGPKPIDVHDADGNE